MMDRRKASLAIIGAIGVLIAFMATEAAACVKCSGSSCESTETWESGNCECVIREGSISGVLICKPKGVCDAVDGCPEEDGPRTKAAEVLVTPHLPKILAKLDPLLASAIIGVVDEHYGKGGKIVAYTLGEGMHEGATMGTREGVDYTISSEVRIEDAVGEVTIEVVRVHDEASFDYLLRFSDSGESVDVWLADGSMETIDLSKRPRRQAVKPAE